MRKNPKRKAKCSGKDIDSVKKTLEKKCGVASKTTHDFVVRKLQKMNYAIVGGHSAVQICRWTKNALRGDRGCWKEKFYGVSSAGCCQMTPAVMWCENQCVHCWRPIELNLGTDIGKTDDPIEILDGIVEARRELLMGFKGRKGIDKKRFEAALTPGLFTMSLSGEPTLYPRLGEMFKEIRKRGAVSFLVTNGLNPEVITGFKKSELPTQITLSANAPNEKLFKIWHRSTKKDAWKKFNETLDVLKKLKVKVRRVVRLTLVRPGAPLGVPQKPELGGKGDLGGLTNCSDENVSEYSGLIRKAEPDFVHVKGYKSVGYARKRMGYDKQPWHRHVKAFALKLADELVGYEIAAEDERSCVVVLARGGTELRIKKV